MVVAKRQGREKPMKIEQRRVRGPEHMNYFYVIFINITMIQSAHNAPNKHITFYFNNIMTNKFFNSLANSRVKFCRIITKDYSKHLQST